MKRLVLLSVIVAMVALPLVGSAQQQPPQPPGQPPAMGPGMMSPGMMGPGMTGGGQTGMSSPMHQMMHQMMMGGMMGGDPKDPKAMGRMLQMRGEMLKAIGDVLIKYGKLMEEGK